VDDAAATDDDGDDDDDDDDDHRADGPSALDGLVVLALASTATAGGVSVGDADAPTIALDSLTPGGMTPGVVCMGLTPSSVAAAATMKRL